MITVALVLLGIVAAVAVLAGVVFWLCFRWMQDDTASKDQAINKLGQRWWGDEYEV